MKLAFPNWAHCTTMPRAWKSSYMVDLDLFLKVTQDLTNLCLKNIYQLGFRSITLLIIKLTFPNWVHCITMPRAKTSSYMVDLNLFFKVTQDLTYHCLKNIYQLALRSITLHKIKLAFPNWVHCTTMSRARMSSYNMVDLDLCLKVTHHLTNL